MPPVVAFGIPDQFMRGGQVFPVDHCPGRIRTVGRYSFFKDFGTSPVVALAMRIFSIL